MKEKLNETMLFGWLLGFESGFEDGFVLRIIGGGLLVIVEVKIIESTSAKRVQ